MSLLSNEQNAFETFILFDRNRGLCLYFVTHLLSIKCFILSNLKLRMLWTGDGVINIGQQLTLAIRAK